MPHTAQPEIAVTHTKLKRTLRKPTVLFVHGLGFDRGFWDPLLQENQNDYNAITYDLEGVGESGISAHAPTMEHYVDTLLWVAKKNLRKERPILCGHGLGGMMVFRALEVAPQQFSGIVVIGAFPFAPDRNEMLDVSQTLREINSQSTKSYIAHYIKHALYEREHIESIMERVVDYSPATFKQLLMAQLTRIDTAEALTKTTLPALLITGEHDTVTSPRIFLELCLRIDGAQFIRIPEAAHLSPLEEPAALHTVLRGFVQAIEKQTEP